MKHNHCRTAATKAGESADGGMRARAPITEGPAGAGRAGKRLALTMSLAAAIGTAGAGCTFNPEGLRTENVQTDAGVDTGTGGQAGHDTGAAGHDTSTDTSGGQAGRDTGTDSGGVDAGGSHACASATAGVFEGILSSSKPETVGGYLIGYAGKVGGDALFSIECGGSVLEEKFHCPVGSERTLEDKPSGMKVTINAISAGSSVANVSISVEPL